MEKMPQNIESEQMVLGSGLVDPEVFSQLRWLRYDEFYRDVHKTIWRVAQELTRQGIPAEIMLLADELERQGLLDEVGGQSYLSHLFTGVQNSTTAEYYARNVRRSAIARGVIEAAGKIAALAYEETDPQELRQKSLDLIVKATGTAGASNSRQLSLVLQELVEETLKRGRGDLADHLLLTRFADLDRLIVGLEPGDLVLLAGRPRMGKSALGQAILLNVARQIKQHGGGSCDYITLEMTALQQTRRMVSSTGEINSQAIRSGFRDITEEESDYDEDMMDRFGRVVAELNEEIGETVYISDEGMTIEQLRSHLISAVAGRKCRCVLVDQIDLFTDVSLRTETEQISAISKALKQIAKELRIVVLCLVQLNRKLEDRSGSERRPRLADLRMSGRLEQDADMVFFIHRPCLYPGDNPNPHWSQYAELHAAKVREGASGDMIPLCFTGSFATFTDWPANWMKPAIED